MKKLFAFVAAALFAGSMLAADAKVVLDFTDASWGFPSDYLKTEAKYINEAGDSVIINAPEGHKVMTVSKEDQTPIGIIFGKKDATLKLPVFDFPVSKILVTGLSNASGKVTTNIFVGDAAVSTEMTGSKETNTFVIAADKREAGNVFVLKITNANNAQAAKIEIFEDDGSDPEPQPEDLTPVDTLNIADAITAGMALDSMATSKEVHAVEGFVINAGAFSQTYHNQTWEMADAADATASDFKAYNCFAIEGADTLKVLNGDKVRLIGKLKKYYDKNAQKYIIEIEKGDAEFLSKVEGNHGTEVEVKEATVAEALEIGAALADNAVTEEMYTITGFVSAIEVEFSDQYKNESFWVAAEENSTAATNADGAFYVYRGKPETGAAVEVGSKVEFTCTIKKYVKDATTAPVVENADANIVVKVLAEPRMDTIRVDQAVVRALMLGDNEISAKKFAIVGYVKSIKTAYDAQYENVSFYMVDDDPDDASKDDIQVFRGKISKEQGEALTKGDFVVVVGNLKNNFYNDKNTPQVNEGSKVEVLYKSAIENILVNNPKINKVIMNGVVYIVRDGKMFTLQGAQVK